MFARIAQFTAACSEGPLPERAAPLGEADLLFAARVIVEELMELLETRMDHNAAQRVVMDVLGETWERLPPKHVAAAQADALVDLSYFCGDVAAR